MNKCVACNEEKEEVDFIEPCSQQRRSKCQDCRRKEALERYYKNHEQNKARMRRCYDTNKDVRKQYAREYRTKNREKVRSALKTWKEKNRERIIAKQRADYRENKAASIAKVRAYQVRNKEKIRAYQRNRRKNDKAYALRLNLRTAITRCLKGKKRGLRTMLITGYSVQELMIHLERQFKIGMTWENYGSAWHIDHRIPLSSFSINGVDGEFRKAWALENLQPKWAAENRKKSNKYSEPSLQQIFQQEAHE